MSPRLAEQLLPSLGWLRDYRRADLPADLLAYAMIAGLPPQVGLYASIAPLVVYAALGTSRYLAVGPVAVVGRLSSSEHFRNVERHPVATEAEILAVRIDESLFFGNARVLQERIHKLLAEHPETRVLLLIASGINHIDATGLACLERCAEALGETGVELHLAEVKGPVQDRLRRANFLERLGPGRLHLSAHEAMDRLAARASEANGEAPLPPLTTVS